MQSQRSAQARVSYFTCGKRIVDIVEGNGVDWVNLLNVVFL